MFCGSCMHDNTWARALMNQGHEVSLIPTYTPIRVDEANLSDRRVFFGGINVYAEYRIPWLWSRTPRVLTRWLDSPWVIGLATKFGVSNNADDLGALTLAMLDGEAGPQRREIEELVDFLAGELKPDAIIFSNALLVGAVRRLKERFAGPVFCMLQGDDIFLEDLPEPYRGAALARIHERAQQFDGFLVHSRYYRDFMAMYLGLPPEKFHLLPLGIDFEGHDGIPQQRNGSDFTVGYFARVCPEKGLHQLVDAFRILHARHPAVRLRAGGYLGKRDQKYFRDVCHKCRDLGDAFEYAGSPATHAEKVAFFKSLDVLSVPTVYREPKGLYVLEALANGVPVVQPRHGSFPELIEATGGGLLVDVDKPEALADALESLMHSPDSRLTLAREGHRNVRAKFGEQALAEATLAALEANRKRGAITAPVSIAESVP
jgi:glycosyltransferase involved in cell wall biosynthesis